MKDGNVINNRPFWALQICTEAQEWVWHEVMLKIAYHPIRNDMQKGGFLATLNYSRIFHEILVHYRGFSGRLGKELKFAGMGTSNI